MIGTAKYVCDCGQEYADLKGLSACQISNHGKGFPHGSVLEEIAAERRRQIEREGYTPEHDDAHDDGAIAMAAAAYAVSGAMTLAKANPEGETAQTYAFAIMGIAPEFLWPWSEASYKPKSVRANYVRAAALLLAEIERLDRVGKAALPINCGLR